MSFRSSSIFNEPKSSKYDSSFNYSNDLIRFGVKQEEVESLIHTKKVKRVYPEFIISGSHGKHKTNRKYNHRRYDFNNNKNNYNNSFQNEEDTYLTKRKLRSESSTNQKKNYHKRENDNIIVVNIKIKRRHSETPRKSSDKIDQKPPKNITNKSYITQEEQNLSSSNLHQQTKKLRKIPKHRSYSVENKYVQTDDSLSSTSKNIENNISKEKNVEDQIQPKLRNQQQKRRNKKSNKKCIKNDRSENNEINIKIQRNNNHKNDEKQINTNTKSTEESEFAQTDGSLISFQSKIEEEEDSASIVFQNVKFDDQSIKSLSSSHQENFFAQYQGETKTSNQNNQPYKSDNDIDKVDDNDKIINKIIDDSEKLINLHSNSLEPNQNQSLIHHTLLIDQKSEVEYQHLNDQDIQNDHHHLIIDHESKVEQHLNDQEIQNDQHNHHNNLIIDHDSKVEHHLNDYQYENEFKPDIDSYFNTDYNKKDESVNIDKNVDIQQNDKIKTILQNKEFYLRCLVKISDDHPIRYDEIPKEYIDAFTLPGISQALDISIDYKPEIDYSKVENYIDKLFKDNDIYYDNINDIESISKFDHIAEQIKDNFESDIEKIYACFYFVTHHVQYDHERSLEKKEDRKDLSIEHIIENKKGVCSDYAVFYRELVKRSGIKTEKIPIYKLTCASKAAGYDSQNPPEEPDFNHESNVIKINNEYFISESTWAAGTLNDKNEFGFDYRKSYFLIPYYKGLLTHFPENQINESLNKVPFSWNDFIKLNKPNIQKELSIESNPFRMIQVDDGFYDMQISLIQPVNKIFGKLTLMKDNTTIKLNRNLVTFTCLEKDLPSHQFSLSPEKRCRYKISIHFPEIGNYKLETYANKNNEEKLCSFLFETYFEVNQIKQKSIDIKMINAEKYSFIPITPNTGLTKIMNGYARIRYAIKWINSPVLLEFYNEKDNLNIFDDKSNDENDKSNDDNNKSNDDNNKSNDNNDKSNDDNDKDNDVKENKDVYYHYFATEIPFINYDWDNSNDFLVENWILIKFPEIGQWKVDVYFKNDKNDKSYTHGASYYFDVEGTEKKNHFPLFDLPNNRKFAPFISKAQKKLWTNPSTQTVIIYNFDFYFHIYCEEDLNISCCFEDESKLFPKLLNKKKNPNNNIFDFEYSITFNKYGEFKLNIFVDHEFIGSQDYFVLDRNALPIESENEKKLMSNLQNKLEGKYDYNDDIPTFIKKDVENMMEQLKKQ